MINTPIFLNLFQDELDLIESFGLEEDSLAYINIIFADYSILKGEGEAYILFEEEGILYEVHAAHGISDSLTGQWTPSEVSVVQFLDRIDRSESLELFSGRIIKTIKDLEIGV